MMTRPLGAGHPFLAFIFGLLVLAALAVPSHAWDETSPFASADRAHLVRGEEIKRVIENDFIAYDPDYLRNQEVYGKRLHALARELAAVQATGKAVTCSNQIFLEAKWLYHYTADWPRLDGRLRQLANSLKNLDQAFASEQSPKDGLWGICYQEWFLKAEATFEAVEELRVNGRAPKYAIKNVRSITSPSKLQAYLESLLISDIAKTGRDNRAELASMTTLLSASYFKDYMQDFLNKEIKGIPRNLGVYSPIAFETVYESFLMSWQDHEIGYWGAWYHSNEQIYKSIDLSITYHIVAYRRGEVDYWPQIIETTFGIRDDPYPYGWMHNGHFNNHNNYDASKILKLGWPHMTDMQKRRASNEIRLMLHWTLNESVNSDGSFKTDPTFFSSVGADYYFGVSFLDQIGFWDPEQRFWTDTEFQNALQLCELIKSRLDELSLDQSESQEALRRLEKNC